MRHGAHKANTGAWVPGGAQSHAVDRAIAAGQAGDDIGNIVPPESKFAGKQRTWRSEPPAVPTAKTGGRVADETGLHRDPLIIDSLPRRVAAGVATSADMNSSRRAPCSAVVELTLGHLTAACTDRRRLIGVFERMAQSCGERGVVARRRPGRRLRRRQDTARRRR